MRGLSDKDLEGLLEQMDEGFYSESEIKRFMAYIEQELEFRKNGRLDPYTAFRKGLKSGKIGLSGVAGTKRNRPDYSSIEEEEEIQQDMAGDWRARQCIARRGRNLAREQCRWYGRHAGYRRGFWQHRYQDGRYSQKIYGQHRRGQDGE